MAAHRGGARRPGRCAQRRRAADRTARAPHSAPRTATSTRTTSMRSRGMSQSSLAVQANLRPVGEADARAILDDAYRSSSPPSTSSSPASASLRAAPARFARQSVLRAPGRRTAPPVAYPSARSHWGGTDGGRHPRGALGSRRCSATAHVASACSGRSSVARGAVRRGRRDPLHGRPRAPVRVAPDGDLLPHRCVGAGGVGPRDRPPLADAATH